MAWHYDKDKITYFAETDFRGNRVKFGIREEDRARHMYIIGKTGMGKSTLLENLAAQDIANDEGLCFIDPHGGSAELLLRYVPEHRIKDVIYFAPHEMDFPVALNVLENDDPNKRPLIASGILSTFKKVWPDAWSGRMEYFLMNTLLALLETPGSTLLGVNRMYSDKEYREKVIANITDTSVRAFWVDEYANMTEKMVAEATPAIQNKVGQFSMNPIMRNILGQSESTFDIRWIMDNRKIFIVNLSKGRMGETNAALLGALLVTKIYLAAMSRADLSEGDLRVAAPFHLYVDEFQNFANDSFANILSEARKYKLALTIAHQYIEQMPEEVRDAVFGNVGTMVTYRVGAADAEVLEKEFTPVFTMEDIVGLGFAQIYLKLMIKGAASAPFSAITQDKPKVPEINYEKEVREASKVQFGRPRAEVEEIIKEWFTSDKSKGGDDGRPGAKKFAPGQRPAYTPGAAAAAFGGARPPMSNASGAGGFVKRTEERAPAASGQKAEGVSLRDALAGAGLAGAVKVVTEVAKAEAMPAVAPVPPPSITTPVTPVSVPIPAKPVAPAVPALTLPAREEKREERKEEVKVEKKEEPRVEAKIEKREEPKIERREERKHEEMRPAPRPVSAPTPVSKTVQAVERVRAVQATRAGLTSTPLTSALREVAPAPRAPAPVPEPKPQVQAPAQVAQAQPPQVQAPPAPQVQPHYAPQPQYQPQYAPQQPYPPQPYPMAPQYPQQYAPQYPQQYPQYPQYPQYGQPQYPQQQYGYAPQPYYQQPQPYYQAPPPQPVYQHVPLYQPYPPMIHYSAPPMVPQVGMMSVPQANPVSPVTPFAPEVHVQPQAPAQNAPQPMPESRKIEVREEKREEPKREERLRPERREEPRRDDRKERPGPRQEALKPHVRENDGKGPSDEKLDALAVALAKLNASVSSMAPAEKPTEKVVENPQSETPSAHMPKEVPLDVLKKVLES